MDNPFIGTIWLFAGTYAPQGWAFCNGQSMSIQQNTALYTILGTNFGGDGQTTFNLPDLRGRVPVGAALANNNGASVYKVGQTVGVETVALTAAQMPAHNHLVEVSNNDASSQQPQGNFLAAKANYGGDAISVYSVNGAPAPGAVLNPLSITSAGGSTSHENRQPSLAMNYIICVNGTYPMRN